MYNSAIVTFPPWMMSPLDISPPD